MPTYEYRCDLGGSVFPHTFEAVHSMSQLWATCPEHGLQTTKRIPQRVAIGGRAQQTSREEIGDALEERYGIRDLRDTPTLEDVKTLTKQTLAQIEGTKAQVGTF